MSEEAIVVIVWVLIGIFGGFLCSRYLDGRVTVGDLAPIIFFGSVCGPILFCMGLFALANHHKNKRIW
jgi:hypothetical protein